jgi:hypothetical protein
MGQRSSKSFVQGHALIVGVGADLPNTVDDAVGLADILRDPARCAYPPDHVHLFTGEGATRAAILSAFDTLAQSTNSQSTIVVYFSGHGYRVTSPVGESYYLLPYGYDLTQLPQTTISGAEFTGRLRAVPAQKRLVLLDCCHAGGVGEAKAPALQLTKSPLPFETQSLLAQGSGTVLIASSQEDELSFVGRPYSAFTLALIEALCGVGVAKKDGYVRVADLALHTREVVPGRTDGRQHPILHFEQADNFVLAYYAGGDTWFRGSPFVFVRVEPFRLPDEAGPTSFPPPHLVPRLELIQRAIEQVLPSVQPEQDQSYFRHVDQVVEYLKHFVKLLPPDCRLNELETFTLVAAAYLHDIGRHFPQPERTLVLKRRMAAINAHTPEQVAELVNECYHELSWEWIKNSLADDGTYPSLGLTSADPVSEIALVCLGHRDADLGDARYRASDMGPQRIRPALLAALLSVADMLAMASLKPEMADLRQSREPLETQVSAWLRYYLDRVSVQDGHIRFHYQLPTDDYSLSVRVLLSGPIQLRLQEIREVLSENGLVIALDSSVDSGLVHEMPPDVLAHAQKLAHQRLTSVIGALGQPSKPQVLYHFTGLRGRPTLKWRSIEGAERYQCQLFDMGQNLLAQWETTVPEITLPEDLVRPGVQYEWITYAYRGKRRLRDWEGGIFWLLDEQTTHWINRQVTWYEASAPFERQLMQGRILADYGLYEEASSVYQAVVEQGTGMAQLQARQELIELYEDISRQLNRLDRPSRADRYLDAALTLARELRSKIDQEQLEMEK